MVLDTTFGKLKNRIFDLLYEYSTDGDTVYIADDDRKQTEKKIPDAVNSALIRMYRSLPLGKGCEIQRLHDISPSFYHSGLAAGAGKSIDFYVPSASIILFFRYFGGGSVAVYDYNNSLVARITCTSTESRSQAKKQLPLPYAGQYRIEVTGTLEVFDLCVYENEQITGVAGICAQDEVSFALPSDFESFISVTAGQLNVDTDGISVYDGFGFIKRNVCGGCDTIILEYTKKPPIIDADTEDSYSFELSYLAFEALICLCTAELCRGENAAMHTRLVYKYNDICEGLYEKPAQPCHRNTFYKSKKRVRW